MTREDAAAGSWPIRDDVPLSIEPVLGWRVWRLERRAGALTLVSITSNEGWPAGTPFHASCRRTGRHPSPSAACSCGIYAASSPKALARASVYGPLTSVVGAIAMWGTVVEHARGSRSAVAYPARLALACGACLVAGTHREPDVVIERGAALAAFCEQHARARAGGRSLAAADVRAELLSTYGVDVLPRSRIVPARRGPVFAPARLAAAIGHALGMLFTAVMFLWLGLAVVSVVAWVLAVAIGLVTGTGATATPSLDALPPPRVAARVAVWHASTSGVEPHGDLRQPLAVPDIAFVCGRGLGRRIALVPCSRPSDLFGFAERAEPAGAARDCVVDPDAYSRGLHYWVCWNTIVGADVRPWARAPNPFTTPEAEGGTG